MKTFLLCFAALLNAETPAAHPKVTDLELEKLKRTEAQMNALQAGAQLQLERQITPIQKDIQSQLDRQLAPIQKEHDDVREAACKRANIALADCEVNTITGDITAKPKETKKEK